MVVLEFRLSNPDSLWTLDLKTGNGAVAASPASKPDATLSCSEEDFVAMCLGTTDAMKLFLSGKLKITGNMSAAQKLEFLKKVDPSLVRDAMQSRLGLKTGSSPPAQSGGKAAHAPDVFRRVAARFEKDRRTPDVNAGHFVVFKVQEPDATWQVDFRGAVPAVAERGDADPSVVIRITDDDLAALAERHSGTEGLISARPACAWTATSSWLTHWISWWVRTPFKLRQDGGKNLKELRKHHRRRNDEVLQAGRQSRILRDGRRSRSVCAGRRRCAL